MRKEEPLHLSGIMKYRTGLHITPPIYIEIMKSWLNPTGVHWWYILFTNCVNMVYLPWMLHPLLPSSLSHPLLKKHFVTHLLFYKNEAQYNCRLKHSKNSVNWPQGWFQALFQSVVPGILVLINQILVLIQSNIENIGIMDRPLPKVSPVDLYPTVWTVNIGDACYLRIGHWLYFSIFGQELERAVQSKLSFLLAGECLTVVHLISSD